MPFGTKYYHDYNVEKAFMQNKSYYFKRKVILDYLDEQCN